MATYTTNYHFTKPGMNDPIDISVLNDNFDALDTKLKEIESNGAGVVGSMALSATWEGEGPYTQEVTLPNITAKSKIDLQPDATVLSQLIRDRTLALWVQNDDGELTVYALGSAPTAQLTIQYVRTETA